MCRLPLNNELYYISVLIIIRSALESQEFIYKFVKQCEHTFTLKPNKFKAFFHWNHDHDSDFSYFRYQVEILSVHLINLHPKYDGAALVVKLQLLPVVKVELVLCLAQVLKTKPHELH